MTENGYGVSFWSDGNVPKLNCGDGCTIFLNLLRLGLLPKHVFPGEHTSVILSSTILSPREGDGTPLQYSCLENPTDGGAWWGPWGPWGREESDTTEQLHFHSVYSLP